MIFSIILLLLNGIIFKKVLDSSRGCYLNLFYAFFYVIQLSVAVLLCMLEPDFALWNRSETSLLAALPAFSLAIIAANMGILMAVRLSRSRCNQCSYTLYNVGSYLNEEYSLTRISFFFLIGFSFTILTSLNIGYIIAVFALSFSFSPVIIGLTWTRLPIFHRLVWIIVLLINLAFHSVQGSRGTALFPVIFVIVGYLLSIRNNKQLFKKRMALFGLVGILSLPFLSFVAEYRENIGRGEDVSIEAFEKMIAYAGMSTVTSDKDDTKNSIGRILVHPNVAAAYMTPSRVGYRSFDNMLDEVKSIFILKGDSGAKADKIGRANLGYGVGVGTLYGFTVNEYTSSEWPVLADGLSRFGLLGAWMYSFLFALFLSFLENRVQAYSKKNVFVSLVLWLFILYNGVLSYMFSYYDFIKVLLFRMTFVFFMMLVFCPFFRKRRV